MHVRPPNTLHKSRILCDPVEILMTLLHDFFRVCILPSMLAELRESASKQGDPNAEDS
jgi:hypothetical protein